MAAEAATRALFAEAVRDVLRGWAALQLAVAQGFGGPQSPEKASWLVGVLTDFFTQNNDLEEEEVEDFLAEVMDNEFDTVVEDGSLQQVSHELVSLFSRASKGDTGGVAEALRALEGQGPAHPPPSHAHSSSSPTSYSRSPTVCNHTPEKEQEMECEDLPPLPKEEDGWTLVGRRRR